MNEVALYSGYIYKAKLFSKDTKKLTTIYKWSSAGDDNSNARKVSKNKKAQTYVCAFSIVNLFK